MNLPNKEEKSRFNPAVFYSAAGLIFLIVLYAAVFPKHANTFISGVQDIIIVNGSWFYVLTVATITLVVAYLALSKFGDIKLGLDHSTPEYNNTSWFAMLFSAGIGIGLMFFGIAEPVMHFLSPPNAQPSTIDAAKKAMTITIFHWGLHAWAIYAIVSILLAFFAFRHNLPLSLRSSLYPLIGDKIYGPIGHAIDTFAVIGTVFGIATSLGFGVLQVNAGFNHAFGVPIGIMPQIIFIVVITIFATLSVASGLDRGIKILSEINMGLAVLLMLFILIFGSTIFLIQAIIQNTGEYLSVFLKSTFNLFAYKKTDWIGGWTVFYWAWWISWSPFVGLFIARISKGRTIREFIVGILLLPVGFTIIWFTIFGNSAIDMILNQGLVDLGKMVSKDVSLALYLFLEQFPFSYSLTIIATIMVIIFFVTSADSGAMVVNMLCSDGKDNTPIWQKVFWTFSIGIIAGVLLIAGGLNSLQTMTIASALPFSIALLFAIYGLIKALKVDMAKKESLQFNTSSYMPGLGSENWKEKLHNVISYPSRKNVRNFLENSVKPALEDIAAELKASEYDAQIINEKDKISLQVNLLEGTNFLYEVQIHSAIKPNHTQEETQSNEEERYSRAEVFLIEGGQDYDIMGWTKDGIRSDVAEQLQKHMHFLYIVE